MVDGSMISKKEMETVLVKELKRNKEYHEVLKIVKSNTKGKIWLIGGAVSRNIIKAIYEYSQPRCDFDFLVEKLKDKLVIPSGWTLTKNRLNNPRLRRGHTEVDIVPLKTAEYILQNKLKPSINNFLAGTPLDVQSLAFDIETEKLVGPLGIKALQKKEIHINNSKRFLARAQRKSLTPEEFLQQTAKSLKFKAVFQ